MVRFLRKRPRKGTGRRFIKDIRRVSRVATALTPAAVARRSGQKLVTGTIPIGGAGAGAARGTVGVLKKIKSGVGRAAGDPFAGTTLRSGLSGLGKRVAGRTVTGLAGVEAFQLARTAATGEEFSPIPSGATLKGALAFGLNPLAGVAGLFTGGTQRGVSAGTTVLKDFIPDFPEIPPTIFNFPSQPDPSGFTPSSAQPPVGAFFPSVDISAGVGGGDSSLIPLLLFLLAAGAGGFALGKMGGDDDEENGNGRPRKRRRKTKKNKKK
jgi:hypothetical protein